MSESETTSESTNEATTETTSEWNSGISEDFRNDPGLDGVSNINDLAKGYLSSQRMLGGRIKIPTEESTPEARTEFNNKLLEIPGVVRIPEEGDEAGRSEFFAKLGRPETHEQYTYKTGELPEGLEGNKEMTEWFLKSAHQEGLPDTAVKNILGQWDQMLSDQHTQKMAAMGEAEASMKKEWGNDYGRRMGAARALLGEHGSDELVELIESSGLGNNPYMTKFLSNVALLTLEDSAIDTGMATASETPAEVNEQLAMAMSNPAYSNSKDPMHKIQVDKVLKLQQKIVAFA